MNIKQINKLSHILIPGEALPLDILFSRENTKETQLLDIIEYTKTSRETYRLKNAHLKLKNLDLKNLVIYIPGWLNMPSDESSTTIVNALLKDNAVVSLLDTQLSFCRGYVGSASRVKATARSLYFFLRKLHQSGFPLSSVHIIGFSLGAHVAGMAGKLVQTKLDSHLGRITALDPAKPCFARPEYRLSSSDANFVQVIHSNSGVLGLVDPMGDVDVYINGLSGKQPECKGRSITVECDHSQAWKLYSSSVENPNALSGKRCENWEQLEEEKCSGEMVALGYSCPTNLTGIFLYKSANVNTEQNLKVFNPLDFKTWL